MPTKVSPYIHPIHPMEKGAEERSGCATPSSKDRGEERRGGQVHYDQHFIAVAVSGLSKTMSCFSIFGIVSFLAGAASVRASPAPAPASVPQIASGIESIFSSVAWAAASDLPVSHATLTGAVLVNRSTTTNPPVTLAATDEIGEIDQFVAIDGIPKDAADHGVQVVQTGIQNAPETVPHVVSDIDDAMHITKVFAPNEGLNSSFVNPHANALGIPELYLP
ncbi:hypothetical protein EVG20_g11686 [Dentipellis fragilis]|uniref:Uncharacterized protein n=1 Tax=Dentipellis fragilis TaxID=205917 RepID=A0A4Y9XKG5_9AGAM|nr:hypothetical protein EVG20_g11686 [Dentipellis fragilis]